MANAAVAATLGGKAKSKVSKWDKWSSAAAAAGGGEGAAGAAGAKGKKAGGGGKKGGKKGAGGGDGEAGDGGAGASAAASDASGGAAASGDATASTKVGAVLCCALPLLECLCLQGRPCAGCCVGRLWVHECVGRPWPALPRVGALNLQPTMTTCKSPSFPKAAGPRPRPPHGRLQQRRRRVHHPPAGRGGGAGAGPAVPLQHAAVPPVQHAPRSTRNRRRCPVAWCQAGQPEQLWLAWRLWLTWPTNLALHSVGNTRREAALRDAAVEGRHTAAAPWLTRVAPLAERLRSGCQVELQRLPRHRPYNGRHSRPIPGASKRQ